MRSIGNFPLFALLLLPLPLVTLGEAAEEVATYTTKYDNVNIDSILSNDRLRNNYLKCLLGEGKCNPQGAVLKEIVPDALKTACRKCNELQRRAVVRIVRYMMTHQPKDWTTLKSKYDPSGRFEEQFRELLKET